MIEPIFILCKNNPLVTTMAIMDCYFESGTVTEVSAVSGENR